MNEKEFLNAVSNGKEDIIQMINGARASDKKILLILFVL